MKILHIVAGELHFGAARGAYWLHEGLNKEEGISSVILTNARYTRSYNLVYSYVSSKKSLYISKIKTHLDKYIIKCYPNREDKLFSTGFFGYDITKSPFYKEADIIHLHWINGGLLKIKSLVKVDKPIVWTLRDMWPFTGGCHYSMDCDNYLSQCGNCPVLNSNKENDLSRKVFLNKSKYLPKHIHLVGISNWISGEARRSLLFRDYRITTIFNSIDTDIFKSIPKSEARKRLSIKTTKKIILSGSIDLNAVYKGFTLFLESLKYLDKNKYMLCFFGKVNETQIAQIDFEYLNFGFIKDIKKLNLIYSSADVFVFPSIMEAFGKTIVESMASGTPVVCFDSTGPKDIVDHKVNGFRAKPNDPQNFAEGIEWILENDDYDFLMKSAKHTAKEKFDNSKVTKEYKRLYEKILNEYKQ